jgi:hypothetical protein
MLKSGYRSSENIMLQAPPAREAAGLADPQTKARIANFAAEPMPMPGRILSACWPAAVTKSL